MSRLVVSSEYSSRRDDGEECLSLGDPIKNRYVRRDHQCEYKQRHTSKNRTITPNRPLRGFGLRIALQRHTRNRSHIPTGCTTDGEPLSSTPLEPTTSHRISTCTDIRRALLGSLSVQILFRVLGRLLHFAPLVLECTIVETLPRWEAIMINGEHQRPLVVGEDNGGEAA